MPNLLFLASLIIVLASQSLAINKIRSFSVKKKQFQNPFEFSSNSRQLSNEITTDQNHLLKLSKIGREKPINVFQPAIILPRNPNKIKNTNNRKSNVYSMRRRLPNTVRGINHIKSIYSTFQGGNAPFNDDRINTVRYVPSKKVDSNGKMYFIFNISLLSSAENVLKAEMYINRKYIRQRLTFDLHYFLYSTLKTSGAKKQSQKQNSASMTIDLRNFFSARSNKKNHWQSFNIIESIKSYLFARNKPQTFLNNTNTYYTFKDNMQNNKKSEELVLIMEATSLSRSRRRSRTVPDHFNPYLIISSHENKKQMKQFFESRISPSMSAELAKKASEDKVTLTNIMKITDKKEIDDLQRFEDQVDKLNNMENSIQSSDTFHSKNKSTLLADYLVQKSKAHEPQRSYYDEYLAKTDKIIYKDAYKKRVKKRYANDNQQPFDESKFNQTLLKMVKNDIPAVKCNKKPLLIDFLDLSFSSWILEPKQYQTNYCSGSCSYPLNKNKVYSNYATLQGILHTLKYLNKSNSPPKLCCAPSSMRPLPILYIDRNTADHVVKLLPDMLVDECSCR